MKLFLSFKKGGLRSMKGFILPFTMLISTLILLVSGSTLTLLTKQLYFSRMYKQSQTAYYAADDAMACIIDVDDTYTSADGLGIFPSSTSTNPATYIASVMTYINDLRAFNGLTAIALSDITCAQSSIFTGGSGFSVATTTFRHVFKDGSLEEGRTSTLTMNMDLGLDPNGTTTQHLFRCAKITVNKTQSFRQIVSQGYAQCNNPNGTIERAVVNTTEVQ